MPSLTQTSYSNQEVGAPASNWSFWLSFRSILASHYQPQTPSRCPPPPPIASSAFVVESCLISNLFVSPSFATNVIGELSGKASVAAPNATHSPAGLSNGLFNYHCAPFTKAVAKPALTAFAAASLASGILTLILREDVASSVPSAMSSQLPSLATLPSWTFYPRVVEVLPFLYIYDTMQVGESMELME